MEIRRVGSSALLVDLTERAEGAPSVEAWRADFVRRRAAGDFHVDEIVPGARTILLDGVTDIDALVETMPSWPAPAPAALAVGELITIPTWYDGPDLDAVAAAWRMSAAEAVAIHMQTEFRVAFSGFAPGFAYLTGLPPSLAVPRHVTPRTQVATGSVALADAYCGIYPTPSPGGWQLIGRTDVVLFDVDRTPPALLSPGVRVQFARAES